jgi:ankyrin repeat protein
MSASIDKAAAAAAKARGNAALHEAAFANRAEVVALLCAAAGGWEALALRNAHGRSPLELASPLCSLSRPP